MRQMLHRMKDMDMPVMRVCDDDGLFSLILISVTHMLQNNSGIVLMEGIIS
jgi:hypothetical protein